MTRLLGLIVLAVILWMLLELVLGRARVSLGGRVRTAMPGHGGQAKPKAEVTSEELVRCAGCGTHVPRSRALRRAGVLEAVEESYCSERCLTSATSSGA